MGKVRRGGYVFKTWIGRSSVKILSVDANNRTKAFMVRTEKGEYAFPYAKFSPPPGNGPYRVREVYPDPELGNEGFEYRLENGIADGAHLDAVLEYNKDPDILNQLFIHGLTVEALEAIEGCGLSKRALIRALRTSPSQFYRLIDPTYYGKSLGQLVALLELCGKEVEFVVRDKEAAAPGKGGKQRSPTRVAVL
jgi:hypothetical protein